MHKPTPRELVLVGAALVGASTAATSAVSLYELAQQCGIRGPLGAALPIALDAGAAVAALVWITEQGERRAWGRGVAIVALLATLAGNGVQHAIASSLLEVTLPLVLAVGACIPAMLFACVHMAALMARPAAKPSPSKQQSRRGVNPPAPAAAAPKPVEPPRPALRSVPSGGDREQRLAEIVANGGGRGRVAKEFGVTPTQARTMLETFKARQASS